MIRLTTAIHAHPARKDLAEENRAKLGRAAEIVYDPGPLEVKSCWRGARLCWQRGVELGGTHHLVMEDDALPCRDLVAGVERLVRRYPARAFSLWTTRKVYIERAKEHGVHVLPLGDWLGSLAIVLPVVWLPHLLAWTDANFEPEVPNCDTRLKAWLRAVEKPIYGVVPSLVQHGRPSDSLMDGHNNWRRTTPAWIGADESALSIDWSKSK